MELLPQCPFYEAHKDKTINCSEGTDTAKIALIFKAGTARQMHFDCYCCNDYKDCPVFHFILENKYKGDVQIYDVR